MGTKIGSPDEIRRQGLTNRWELYDNEDLLYFSVETYTSLKPPNKMSVYNMATKTSSRGWLKARRRRLACSETHSPDKRRRLKSRAELLAERFARHCATVARR